MEARVVWGRSWRDEVWSRLGDDWDVLVVGGGITGAGIFREAVRAGLKTLLVEQRDFAWGTSSRSSKLVHGGLRYLKGGHLGLTYQAVRERRRLLREAPGLVDPVPFLYAARSNDRVGRLLFRLGLSIYDLMAGQWSHRYYAAEAFRLLAPHVSQEGLDGGFAFEDAQTDDARLVLRVIREAVARGGVALNYASVESLRRERGRVAGFVLRDGVSGRTAEIRGRTVVNATGAWADRLRREMGREARVRPLRGSHLVFPSGRLPTAGAIMFPHPWDRRPLFIIPWEGATLLGTTDLDHDQPLEEEPRISTEEVTYLMAAVHAELPSLELSTGDVTATFAGVRPVIGTGKANPSKESREHAVWEEEGLLTVTGGKLTTFRVIARDVLARLRRHLPGLSATKGDAPALEGVEVDSPSVALDPTRMRRLLGRYGFEAPALLSAARAEELEEVPGTRTLWAELRWAARAEGVVHLEDLMLRRVRLGLLLADGGLPLMPRIGTVCQEELGWTETRWKEEVAAYEQVWRTRYSLPDDAGEPQRKKGKAAALGFGAPL